MSGRSLAAALRSRLHLQLAALELGRCRWWSEVAHKMQRLVESAGFSVVTQYVGHGIGRTMHENPQVPNYVSRETRKYDFRLEPGLVLAVEPMVNMGRADADTLSDHWTVVTRDGLPSAHVEHTLALTEEGVLVVPGSSFNVPYRHHFRVTLLPEPDVMREVFARIDRCLARRAERVTKVVPLKSRSAVA